MKADLHCHTTISDGSLGISDVIRQADRDYVLFLAITDHYRISSLYLSEVIGNLYNFTFIPSL